MGPHTIASLALTLLAASVLSLADPVLSDRSSTITCMPEVHTYPNMPAVLIQSASTPKLFWTMMDYIPAGLTVILGPGPSSLGTQFFTSTAGSPGAGYVQIASAKSPSYFCVDTEKKSGLVLGSTCQATSYLAESYRIECYGYGSCISSNTSGTVIGKSCTVISQKWGQCATSHGNNKALSLGACKYGSSGAPGPTQLFNIVVA